MWSSPFISVFSFPQAPLASTMLSAEGEIKESTIRISSILFVSATTLLAWKLFTVPSRLRHIPAVPILPLLRSYLSGEVEEQRIRNIILPFALNNGHSLVLVWLFGKWIVHIVDLEIGKSFMEDRSYTRQLPPQDMLFWQFVGTSNIFFTEGEHWKRQSRQLKRVLQGPPPTSDLIALSKKTLRIIEKQFKPRTYSALGEDSANSKGVIIPWSELMHRFALDVVGLVILGYDFQALNNPDTPFVNGYHASLDALTSPAYVFVPKLERIFPRRAVKAEMLSLRTRFRGIIQYKRIHPGDDLISRLTEEKGLETEEMVDNVVAMFIAGHDTTAAALSSLVYFLAKHPAHQGRARAEVLSVLSHSEDPTPDTLSQMPYLSACIKESHRMNNPSNFPLPRISREEDAPVGNVPVPSGTPVIFNIAAVHRNGAYWKDVEVYNPTRFLTKNSMGELVMVSDNQAWVSFSIGHRHCPAKAFSLYEQRVMAALLLREYEWTLPENSKHAEGLRNRFCFSALNSPQDLKIKFTRISNSKESC